MGGDPSLIMEDWEGLSWQLYRSLRCLNCMFMWVVLDRQDHPPAVATTVVVAPRYIQVEVMVEEEVEKAMCVQCRAPCHHGWWLLAAVAVSIFISSFYMRADFICALF